jgi:hypothetical protein
MIHEKLWLADAFSCYEEVPLSKTENKRQVDGILCAVYTRINLEYV